METQVNCRFEDDDDMVAIFGYCKINRDGRVTELGDVCLVFIHQVV